MVKAKFDYLITEIDQDFDIAWLGTFTALKIPDITYTKVEDIDQTSQNQSTPLSNYAAQSFTPSFSGFLTSLECYMSITWTASGATTVATTTVDIVEDAGGKPSNSVIGTGSLIKNSSASPQSDTDWQTFIFDATKPIYFEKDKKYWLVMPQDAQTGADTKFTVRDWHYQDTNVYSGGELAHSTTGTSNWTVDTAKDHAFRIDISTASVS